jgi:hypothetical protein
MFISELGRIEMERIRVPMSDSYVYEGVSTDEPCPLCGREVSNPRLFVYVDLATDELVPPDEVDSMTEYIDGGLYPVGEHCVRKQGIREYLIK